MGLPARLPIFIGPLGAVTNLRRSPGDAGKSGIIARSPGLGSAPSPLCSASCSPRRQTRGTSDTCCSRSRTSGASFESHQPDPGRLSRRSQGCRRDPEVDERGRPARGRRRRPALRQPNWADLSCPRHLPHRQQVPGGNQALDPAQPGRFTTPRSRARPTWESCWLPQRECRSPTPRSSTATRSRASTRAHRDDSPRGLGVATADARRSGNGNARSCRGPANTSS